MHLCIFWRMRRGILSALRSLIGFQAFRFLKTLKRWRDCDGIWTGGEGGLRISSARSSKICFRLPWVGSREWDGCGPAVERRFSWKQSHGKSSYRSAVSQACIVLHSTRNELVRRRKRRRWAWRSRLMKRAILGGVVSSEAPSGP